jgi:hypothetical protein
MECPSHPPWYYHLTVLGAQIINLLIAWSSVPSCRFLSHRSKYCHQCPVLRKRPSFTPVCNISVFCMSLWCSCYTYWLFYLLLLSWSLKCRDLLLVHELWLSNTETFIFHWSHLTVIHLSSQHNKYNLFLLLVVCLFLQVIWCFEIKSGFYFISEINTKEIKWYIYISAKLSILRYEWIFLICERK